MMMDNQELYEKIASLMDKIMYHDEYPFEVQNIAAHVECTATDLVDANHRDYTALEVAMTELLDKLL